MIPKQLRQLPTPGCTGPTRLAPGATASWLRREAHVTVLVTPSGLPFALGNRLKGSDVCQAGGSLVPARSASRGRRGTGWNFRCDGRRCRAKPAWGWSPTGKGSEPHSQAAEGEATRHGPRRPPSEATYQARAGGRGGLAEPGGHWTLPLSSSYLVSSIFSAVTHSAPRPSGASLHSWERRQAGGLPSWAHTQACPLRRGAEGTARTGIPWLGDTRVEGLPIAPVLGDKSCALGRGTRRSLA